jgi:hypothetical protein
VLPASNRARDFRRRVLESIGSWGPVRAATITRYRSWLRARLALAWILLQGALPACGPVNCPPGTTLDGEFCVRDGSAAARVRSAGSGGAQQAFAAAGAMAAIGGSGKPAIANAPPIHSLAAGGGGSPALMMLAPCPASACMPGGTCVAGPTDYACSCGLGYAGTDTKRCTKLYIVQADQVSDAVTHLIWQLKLSPSTYSERDAAAYCHGLMTTIGGWRVPTKDELLSIVDLSVPAPGPTIDATAFPATPAACFWTSSPFNPSSDGTTNSYWSIDFGHGSAVLTDVSMPCQVRCVHLP